MQQIYRTIATVSQNKSTVLITGASGTGKELVARTLHAKSPWSRGPFIAVNCGAFSESLLDSQLFGHRRGSLTGAINDQAGVFQAATGGTLFLYEVSEIPIALQGKFLRAIRTRDHAARHDPARQDRRPAGRGQQQDLRAQIKAGEFREDLFYRLNVVNIHMPRLAERRGDIPALIDHFIGEFARSYGVAAKVLSDAARGRLQAHDWPGNIRELQNTIGGRSHLHLGHHRLDDIAPALPFSSASMPAAELGRARSPLPSTRQPTTRRRSRRTPSGQRSGPCCADERHRIDDGGPVIPLEDAGVRRSLPHCGNRAATRTRRRVCCASTDKGSTGRSEVSFMSNGPVTCDSRHACEGTNWHLFGRTTSANDGKQAIHPWHEFCGDPDGMTRCMKVLAATAAAICRS
jgi:hypothetical protein